jgi:tRNA-dihydrouridine synthase B
LTRDAQRWLTEHLHDHYALYGEFTGVRSARKHIGWAVSSLPGGLAFRAAMNGIEDCEAQLSAVTDYFDQLAETHLRLPAANEPARDREQLAAA